MINREKFFGLIRHQPFPGHMVESQVEGIEVLLDTAENIEVADPRWLAYILATAFHETAHTMQPVEEFGKGHDHPYGRPINGHAYYGRGFVQLTWDYNYKKLGEMLGVDLLDEPELALEPVIAALILFDGMIKGVFTGKKLADYFNDYKTDWVNARKIINGLDRATMISRYAEQFYDAVKKAT